ncbi:formylglycine-generating enzyme family protein [Polyangium fumosum]|uniref:Sulfatase-modifying factor enzyme-like domain-containing protein n=1 Tax=Polyangium fumosum TaxID=889272 RepID=A0A4U1JJC4_9BACT|nr:SUMF1/EgtB/PvdO family nonheme iron enzyme [Polyangium fumosum]TKD12592.1 hypothetical protein E8A74_02225 [Polyangium fumosum]
MLRSLRRPLLLGALLLTMACSSRGPTPEVGPSAPPPEPLPVVPNPPSIAAPPPLEPKKPAPPAPVEPSPPPAPPETSALPARVDGMILVPAGPFTMGADTGGEADEWPAHTVTLPAYYLDEFEVTNGAYARCIEAKLCPPPEPSNADRNGVGPDKRFRGPKQPVSSVSWDSARAYCAFVDKRLPREAELEKAARGESGRLYPWGHSPPGPERAVFAVSVTADVGTHPAGRGPYGHHDLAGNVWEWAEDIYDPFAYKRAGASEGRGGSCEETLEAYAELRRKRQQGFTGSNKIPTECERVLRGGGFNYHATGLRSTNRVHHPARYRMVMSGFRCARDAKG